MTVAASKRGRATAHSPRNPGRAELKRQAILRALGEDARALDEAVREGGGPAALLRTTYQAGMTTAAALMQSMAKWAQDEVTDKRLTVDQRLSLMTVLPRFAESVEKLGKTLTEHERAAVAAAIPPEPPAGSRRGEDGEGANSLYSVPLIGRSVPVDAFHVPVDGEPVPVSAEILVPFDDAEVQEFVVGGIQRREARRREREAEARATKAKTRPK